MAKQSRHCTSSKEPPSRCLPFIPSLPCRCSLGDHRSYAWQYFIVTMWLSFGISCASTRRMKSSVPPSTTRMQSCEGSAANSTDLLSRKPRASNFSEGDLNTLLVDGDCDRYSS
ncbi:hypothetical protein K525DRAFT_202588 [Schizophyllum commune Loenen D]|nr:hypothetical protein K525DRAFT_202588 [Schizophyllum commune Loenen D]